jgi:hypothetical protein
MQHMSQQLMTHLLFQSVTSQIMAYASQVFVDSCESVVVSLCNSVYAFLDVLASTVSPVDNVSSYHLVYRYLCRRMLLL